MSKRDWIVAATIGLALWAASGQAQEEAQGEQRRAETQEQPAQQYPVPFPIHIVEDEAAADARERSEAEARQHDENDLIAQQGMNAATQAMNEATQRMANHSFWSTLAIWIGTALLVGTLVLAVLTNNFAVKAVKNTRELGETQVRAYVGVGKCSFILDGNEARVIAEFMNTGKTPATEMRILWGLHFEAGNEGRYVTAQIHIGSGPPLGSIAIVGAGRTAKPDAKKTLTDGQIAALEAGEARLVFAGTLRYTDVFGHPWAQNFQWANGKDYGAFTRDGPMVASKFNEPEREITNE